MGNIYGSTPFKFTLNGSRCTAYYSNETTLAVVVPTEWLTELIQKAEEKVVWTPTTGSPVVDRSRQTRRRANRYNRIMAWTLYGALGILVTLLVVYTILLRPWELAW